MEPRAIGVTYSSKRVPSNSLKLRMRLGSSCVCVHAIGFLRRRVRVYIWCVLWCKDINPACFIPSSFKL